MKPTEMKYSQLATEDTCPALYAYGNQKRNATRRGKTFTLTFAEWLYIWLASGHWDQRGTLGDEYCMSRVGDAGGYELGNVFIQTNRENLRQGNTGRKPTYARKPCPRCGNVYSGNGMGSHLRSCSGGATK